MSVLDDARPHGWDVWFRPGDTLSRTLTWPAGTLAGKTFTALLDAAALTVNVVGDVMTISATAAQTTTAGLGTHTFVLTETTGGGSDERLIGRWAGSNDPNHLAQSPATLTVALASGAVIVDVDGSAHAGMTSEGGAHGALDHVWAQAGVTGWSKRVMTQDGTQAFSLSVVGNRGRFTANSQTNTNHREAWSRAGASFENCEIRSLLGRSQLFAAGDLAQWGHLHRIQLVSGSLHKAFAVWTDIAFGAPWVLNLAVVTFDGTTLTIGSDGTQPNVQDRVNRTLPIVRAQRVSNVVTVHTTAPWLPAVGDVGAVAGMAAAGFNIGSATVTAVSATNRTFTYAQTAANATDADAGGTWTPVEPALTLPYMLATRLVGNTMLAKQWRPEQPEPDWGDPGRVTTFTFTGGTVPPYSGAGDSALWVAHINESHWLEYGDVHLEKV